LEASFSSYMGFYFRSLKVKSSCNVWDLRSKFKTMERYFLEYGFTQPKRVLFQCRDKLIIRESETVVPRVIELNQSIEEPLINICSENTKQKSIPLPKVLWVS